MQYLREELQGRQTQQASLQALWSHLQPEEEVEDSDEAQEKLHVTGSKLKLLLRQVEWDLGALQQRLVTNSFPSNVQDEIVDKNKANFALNLCSWLMFDINTVRN